MPTVKSWAQLVGELNKIINSTLSSNDVQNQITNVYKAHIEDNVYNTYSTPYYSRRSANGGLSDDSNIIKDVHDNILEIRNVTKPNEFYINGEIMKRSKPYSPAHDTQFSEWIEFGQTYNGNAPSIFPNDQSGKVWTQERPFTQNTITELAQNKQHVQAIKNGLIKRGLNVK